MLTYQEYNTVKDWLFTNHGPHQWFSQKDYCEFLYLLSDGEDWQLARECDQELHLDDLVGVTDCLADIANYELDTVFGLNASDV